MKKIQISTDYLGATLSIYSADLGVGTHAKLTEDEILCLHREINRFFQDRQKSLTTNIL